MDETRTSEDFPSDVTEYFKSQFSLFDKEQNGAIPIADLGNALRMSGLNPTEDDLRRSEAEADPSGTGLCTFGAFMQLLFGMVPSFFPAEKLREAFRSFDDKGTQLISAVDLRYVLCSLGDALSDAEMNELMEEARAKGCIDTDGNLQYEDFLSVLMPDFMKEA